MQESWQISVKKAIARHSDTIREVRRHLHAHPEVSGQEHATSLYLYQLLSNEGLQVEVGPEGRGVVVQPPKIKPRVALRADIDALRIQEQNTVPYCSQTPGVMHACGHDAHSATVFGAILCLWDLVREKELPWPVDWRAIFQPAEETGEGALQMVAHGVLEGIEAIFATHVDPSRPFGQIGFIPGVFTANCDSMQIVVHGRGGHAARPHETKDPIAAAAQFISTLYLFVPRGTDSQESVVVTIGQVIGGENPNAIPEEVTLRGTIRTLDAGVRQRTIDHIRQLARGIAEASGTTIEVQIGSSINSVRNDPALCALVADEARTILGTENVRQIPRPSMGSEDFAAYLEHVPGMMFRLGCAPTAAGSSGLHTPTFDVDERALPIGAEIFANSLIAWSNPDRR
jgi:amidohydrolase